MQPGNVKGMASGAADDVDLFQDFDLEFNEPPQVDVLALKPRDGASAICETSCDALEEVS